MRRRIHGAHPSRHPGRAKFNRAELQAREPVEHAIENHRRQRLHCRVRDGHIADRGEIVVAAMEIRHRRQAVFLVDRVQLVLTADMEKYRQSGLLSHRPDRIEPDMARRMMLRAL